MTLGGKQILRNMLQPTSIQAIGNEIAILWNDGQESYFPMPYLRQKSPSAENIGETDIFGVVHGGAPPSDHSGVRVLNWNLVGNYAIRFEFSDGHRTGLYSYRYLRDLSPEAS